tara:strand:- start:17 stop:316 length:300 start_codon:yes stop_codon:yes gene_type:complete
MDIKNTSSAPAYIERFLQNNKAKLDEIYDAGLQENNGIGCLGLKCSEKENKMDVFFMNEELLLQQLQKESWENLKASMVDKKLYMVNDLDLNSIFLVYL